MNDDSPAEQFDRYLRDLERDAEPLPRRSTEPLDRGEIAVRAFLILAAAALYGSLAYRVARLVGWAP